jgi:protein SCO1/2
VTSTIRKPDRGRNTQKGWLKLFGLALSGLLAGVLLGWLTASWLSGTSLFSSPDFHGTVVQSPVPVNDFTLTGSDGQQVRLHDFRDKVVLLYFGYTYCPDVCPATMAELSKAMKELSPKDREKVQVLMITVDPDRDTPEALGQYLSHFDPSFLGLTGTDEEIATAAEPFGIYYRKRDGTVETGYLVDHTATVAAVDKDGTLRLIYSFNTPGEDIAADLKRLARE